jgi:transketolase
MSQPEINPKNANLWSKLGPRATYGQAILALGQERSDVIALSADLGNSSGLERFSKLLPDRFVDVGIAEQNLIGVASGLAKEGFTVFASSFAPFITMRACEQLRINLGYMGMNVKAVGIGSGLAMGFLGNSHFGLEDVSVVRSIPDIEIISPADCSEIFKAVFAIARSDKPTYLRLTGSPGMTPVYQQDYDFEIGKAINLTPRADILLIATGSMVSVALSVREELHKDRIDCSVTNIHTIRPLDIEHMISIVKDSQYVFVLEEHVSSGGLYSEIMEQLNARDLYPRIKPIGLLKKFDLSGDYEFLKSHHGLDVLGVSNFIRGCLK